MKKIAFGCDHVGFILKHEIAVHLVEHDVEVIDKGIWSLERTDYPHYASRVALTVADGKADGGVLICGTDVSISIVAGRLAGIRAAVYNEPYSARLSRQHNDANVLVLGLRVVGPELAKMTVDIWLSAQYEGGRHQQRVETIMAIKQRRNRDLPTACVDE